MVTTVTAEVDKVGETKQKGQASKEAARVRKLNQLLGQSQQQGQYADPSALFQEN